MSKATIGGESIRQVTSGHQLRRILAVVCAASVMCATSAQARDRDVTRTVIDEQDFPFSDFNPCINSVVAGQGHFHSVFIDRSTLTMFDTTYRFHHNGEATNTVPGDMGEYRFGSSGENRFRSSTRNFTMTMKTREHIIRKGNQLWKDDYFVRSSFKVSGLAPKPVITRESAESTCK